MLSNAAGEVPSILANKNSIKYLGPEVESMAAVARAAKDRSLEKFQEAVRTFAVRTESVCCSYPFFCSCAGREVRPVPKDR